MVPASSCTNQAQVYLLVACNTSYDCFCCSYVNSGWYGTVWYSMVQYGTRVQYDGIRGYRYWYHHNSSRYLLVPYHHQYYLLVLPVVVVVGMAPYHTSR